MYLELIERFGFSNMLEKAAKVAHEKMLASIALGFEPARLELHEHPDPTSELRAPLRQVVQDTK